MVEGYLWSEALSITETGATRGGKNMVIWLGIVLFIYLSIATDEVCGLRGCLETVRSPSMRRG